MSPKPMTKILFSHDSSQKRERISVNGQDGGFRLAGSSGFLQMLSFPHGIPSGLLKGCWGQRASHSLTAQFFTPTSFNLGKESMGQLRYCVHSVDNRSGVSLNNRKGAKSSFHHYFFKLGFLCYSSIGSSSYIND